MKSKANIVVGAVIIVVLIAAIGMFANSQTRDSDESGFQAVVYDGDGNETRLSLSENQQITVQTSLGENIVVVEDGNVFVREADCPNQDCVHQGKIDSPGKQIICLPHKLWIEVVTSNDRGTTEMNVDAVAGDRAVSDEESEAEDLDVVAR